MGKVKYLTPEFAESEVNVMSNIARMRTIRGILEMLKAEDPDTAIKESFIRRLVATGQVSSLKVGNKVLINYDEVVRYLNL